MLFFNKNSPKTHRTFAYFLRKKKQTFAVVFHYTLINVNYRKDCIFKLNFMTKSV
nr:MAG TPA: hypothetical protein [Caudoviricetes sp.]